MRRDAKLWLIAPLWCIWPIAASADESETAKLISECGVADLPQASVDSCLERVRVLEETDPSSQLQTLAATLEQRESGRPAATRAAAAAAPRVGDIAPEPSLAPEGEGDPDQAAAPAAGAESSPPPSGAALDDQPPISDPPDAPTGTDGTTDDTNDPPRS